MLFTVRKSKAAHLAWYLLSVTRKSHIEELHLTIHHYCSDNNDGPSLLGSTHRHNYSRHSCPVWYQDGLQIHWVGLEVLHSPWQQLQEDWKETEGWSIHCYSIVIHSYMHVIHIVVHFYQSRHVTTKYHLSIFSVVSTETMLGCSHVCVNGSHSA